jgi:NTE family protein
VLDRLFEDERLEVEAISGTSAGAMNAVVAAQGLMEGGRDGVRAALSKFWYTIAEAGRTSPFRRGPFDVAAGNWSLDTTPAYLWFDLLSRIASPYDLNPLGISPLHGLLEGAVDFAKVRACGKMKVFLSATDVESGRVRVFHREEITADTVLASACLPYLFHAVEIDGRHYWDGGYVGNPALFPFYEFCAAPDIVIVQINPIYRPGVPRTAREILDRVNEITFNSALMKELRAVHLIGDILDRHHVPQTERRALYLHMIEARKQMRPLRASSKVNTEVAFLEHLFQIGRDAAERWLERNFDALGTRSSLDVPALFGPQSDPSRPLSPDAETAASAPAQAGSADRPDAAE